MESELLRKAYTARGFLAFAAYLGSSNSYELANINIGNNPLSKLEIASALNTFNIAHEMYSYYYSSRPLKSNIKWYHGTIQSVATWWNLDQEDPKKVDKKWSAGEVEKSGSLI